MPFGFFRSGYYEYTKIKKTADRKCKDCGAPVLKIHGGNTLCPTCKDVRRENSLAAQAAATRKRDAA